MLPPSPSNGAIIIIIVPLAFLVFLATHFPANLFAAAAEIDQVLGTIQKSVDGIETRDQRLRWDEDGLRVEEKKWWEKAVEWLNQGLYSKDGFMKGIDHRRRVRRDDDGSEEIAELNAKIVFFKNGSRIVDMENGPLISMEPDGQIQIDYRNGTVQNYMGGNVDVAIDAVDQRRQRHKREIVGNGSSSMPSGVIWRFRLPDGDLTFNKNGTYQIDLHDGPLLTFIPCVVVDFRNGTKREFQSIEEFQAWKNAAKQYGRTKRFATLDDLYMAHGYEFNQREAEQFGQQQAASELRSDPADGEDGNDVDWQWKAEGKMVPTNGGQTGGGNGKDKSAASSYWNKALYDGNDVAAAAAAAGTQIELARPAQEQQQQNAFDNSGNDDVHPPSASPPSPPSTNVVNAFGQMSSQTNQSLSTKFDKIAQALMDELDELPPMQVTWNAATKESFIRNLAAIGCHSPSGEPNALEKVLRKLLNQPAAAPAEPMFEWAQPVN